MSELDADCAAPTSSPGTTASISSAPSLVNAVKFSLAINLKAFHTKTLSFFVL
jgi:hypothetical protein